MPDLYHTIRRPWHIVLLAGLVAIAGCSVQETKPGSEPEKPGARVASTDEFVAREGDTIDPATHPGRDLFYENCADCHNGRVYKAPATVWLEMMAPDVLLAAMNEGLMQEQAATLNPEERVQIAEYLSRTSLADFKAPPPPPPCEPAPGPLAGTPPARVSWGHDTKRFIPGEVAGLTRDDLKTLTLKWAFAFPNAVRARSQPTIGWNTIFVGSQNGTIYAFDLATGCTRWTMRAGAEVRTGIVADPEAKRLYFGDVLGRAYAISAENGALLWRTKIDDHPNATMTATPTLADGRLFVPISSLEVTSAADPGYPCCTFRGSVNAVDPDTGKILWRTHTIDNPPTEQGKTSIGTPVLGPSGAPVWSPIAYDEKRGRLYFGSGENYSSPADENSDAVFAIDANTGEKVWQTQLTRGDAWNVGCMMGNENCPVENGPDVDLSAAPLLITLAGGRDIIVVGQKSGVTYGINVDDGEILWSQRLGHGGTQGGVHFGMAALDDMVFVPIVDMADTHDARTYDESQRGAGIHAISAATGEIRWRAFADNDCGDRQFCDPGISAAATALPGAVIAGHLDGQLHAYDARTGDILWSYDTTQPHQTITGQTGAGGSMSGPGVAIANGHVVSNSGYGLYFHMPGNLLMVFAPANKNPA